MRNSRSGEITTVLTLGTLIVLGLSTFVSTVFLKNKQTTQSKAASTSCTQCDGPNQTCIYHPEFEPNCTNDGCTKEGKQCPGDRGSTNPPPNNNGANGGSCTRCDGVGDTCAYHPEIDAARHPEIQTTTYCSDTGCTKEGKQCPGDWLGPTSTSEKQCYADGRTYNSDERRCLNDNTLQVCSVGKWTNGNCFAMAGPKAQCVDGECRVPSGNLNDSIYCESLEGMTGGVATKGQTRCLGSNLMHCRGGNQWGVFQTADPGCIQRQQGETEDLDKANYCIDKSSNRNYPSGAVSCRSGPDLWVCQGNDQWTVKESNYPSCNNQNSASESPAYCSDLDPSSNIKIYKDYTTCYGSDRMVCRGNNQWTVQKSNDPTCGQSLEPTASPAAPNIPTPTPNTKTSDDKVILVMDVIEAYPQVLAGIPYSLMCKLDQIDCKSFGNVLYDSGVNYYNAIRYSRGPKGSHLIITLPKQSIQDYSYFCYLITTKRGFPFSEEGYKCVPI